VTPDLPEALRRAGVDGCLLALHGRTGGSGEVQSTLALQGVPYVGAGPTAAALAFDKVRSRQILAYHNVPVPASVALGPAQQVNDRALSLLGWPCVLKPRRGSLGAGLTHLTSADQVAAAVDRALAVDDELVLERAIAGNEVQVVMLGERVVGSMQVERDLGEPRTCEMMCPPQLGRSQLEGVHTLARRAVAALGLADCLARVDVIVSPRHNEVVLEVEPLPPLHVDGVVARVARAHGLYHEQLVAQLVDRLELLEPEVVRLPAAAVAAAAFVQ
jgi:D-alanine-D-alanine ligase